MKIALLLLLLGGFLMVAMAGAWTIARQPGKSGWTDAVWSFAIAVAGVLAALAPIDGAPNARQALVAALVACWGIRLGTHIAARTANGGDDPRYAELRREWGAAFPRRLFQFLQVQALAGLLLVISVLLAARNPASRLVWSDGLGAGLLLGSIVGEGLADSQLTRFRRNRAHHGRVCDTGLWRLSRHPNYFFEWLGWVAYAVIAIGPDGSFGWGWLALSGPAFMYLLLVHVSGIPPLEAHMLRSRGDLFCKYQTRVRAFWPIPVLSSRRSRS